MIAQAAAAKLLDDLLYSRVIECVNMGKLMMVELDLWVALCEQSAGNELGSREEAEARDEARLMIERALMRLASARDRYAELQPFGMECADCEEEIAEPRRRRD
ncbi:MAG TPA: hypothetical protein VMZ53_33520 [Kofleriaceae bacterium]|nr:hypothetical protein [Kofleriaceae bacterium]